MLIETMTAVAAFCLIAGLALVMTMPNEPAIAGDKTETGEAAEAA